jgi:hypothetical protein
MRGFEEDVETLRSAIEGLECDSGKRPAQRKIFPLNIVSHYQMLLRTFTVPEGTGRVPIRTRQCTSRVGGGHKGMLAFAIPCE